MGINYSPALSYQLGTRIESSVPRSVTGIQPTRTVEQLNIPLLNPTSSPQPSFLQGMKVFLSFKIIHDDDLRDPPLSPVIANPSLPTLHFLQMTSVENAKKTNELFSYD